MYKSYDRLYLECISDLAEAVRELRILRSNSAVANEMEFRVDAHMRMYKWMLEAQRDPE